jgi:hypothetical protein
MDLNLLHPTFLYWEKNRVPLNLTFEYKDYSEIFFINTIITKRILYLNPFHGINFAQSDNNLLNKNLIILIFLCLEYL